VLRKKPASFVAGKERHNNHLGATLKGDRIDGALTKRRRQLGRRQLAAAASKAGWLLGCAAGAKAADPFLCYVRSAHVIREGTND